MLLGARLDHFIIVVVPDYTHTPKMVFGKRKPSELATTTTTPPTIPSNAHSIPSSPITLNTATGKKDTTSPAPNPTALPVKYVNGMIVEGDYRLERTIGKGSYGKVKLATQLSTGERVALKFISRASIKKPTHWTRIRREINLLRAMHHPHIVKLYEYRDNGADILLMMEYISGGDLFDRIVNHKDQRFSEREARPLFRQIISAVDYCHQNRIIHRDLKPENLMVDDRNQIKLIDFGFANIYSPRGFLETNCGSPLYASPEIVQGVKYVGPEVDIWSLGVILFAMLTGTLPFEDENLKGLYAKICAGKYTCPSYLSPEAQDLIRMMLTTDPKQRATMKDIKFSTWIMNGSIYPPENFLPFRQPLTRSGLTMSAVRDDIIQALEDYGFTEPGLTRQMVLYQPDSPAYALYCSLLEREQRTAKSRTTIKSVAAFPINGGLGGNPTVSNASNASNVSTIPCTTPTHNDSLLDSPKSGSNLVAQAAAHVASKFRKLRDLNFGRTQVVSGSAGGAGASAVSNAVSNAVSSTGTSSATNAATSTNTQSANQQHQFSIAIPSIGPNVHGFYCPPVSSHLSTPPVGPILANQSHVIQQQQQQQQGNSSWSPRRY